MTRVAILGAGINGLSCAVKIKEKYPNLDVVIISNEFTPHTTADGCGGLWYPYICGNTPIPLLCKWGGETYNYLHKLWLEGGYDVSLMPLYELHREARELAVHDWAASVFGYRILDKHQLEYFSRLYSNTYRAGRTFTTFISYPPSILGHLYRRFQNTAGRILKATVETLNDTRLKDFDVVVNCMGLGARDVVPDHNVFPVRGQIARVVAPWVNETVFDEDTGHYIIPNVNHCVLGGTHTENDFNSKVDDDDTDFILNGCKDMIPGLSNAKLISHWVGLRPGRSAVRLDSERKHGKLYIHNYGHGGSGLTLFWGCASEVLEIFDKFMDDKTDNRKKSKL